MRARRLSERTITSYEFSVAQFLRTATELTPRAVESFISGLADSGRAAKTLHTRAAALRLFSEWLYEEGERDTHTLSKLRLPKLDEKVIQPLTDEELALMVKACSGRDFLCRRDEAIVRLLVETGMRASELLGINISDMDITRGQILIRGKGRKERIISYGATTAAVLDRYMRARRAHRLAGADRLWLGGNGQTFGYGGLYEALKRRAEAAGITDFHPHRMRHTAATRWLRAGGSEGGLMVRAGWSRRDMLDRYTKATASDRAIEEAARLNLGDL